MKGMQGLNQVENQGLSKNRPLELVSYILLYFSRRWPYDMTTAISMMSGSEMWSFVWKYFAKNSDTEYLWFNFVDIQTNTFKAHVITICGNVVCIYCLPMTYNLWELYVLLFVGSMKCSPQREWGYVLFSYSYIVFLFFWVFLVCLIVFFIYIGGG